MAGNLHLATLMKPGRRPGAATIAIALLFAVPHDVRAHCDSLEGPVVADARAALEQGDPASVLKWVGRESEGEIREAFARTMAVRAKGDDARALADRYFFETVVRIHRAGEGEAFTGLKPADRVAPGIVAADQALRTGSADALATRLAEAVRDGVRKRFLVVLERKKDAAAGVDAGRRYVEAYVDYVHFVEGVDRLASHGASHAHHEPASGIAP